MFDELDGDVEDARPLALRLLPGFERRFLSLIAEGLEQWASSNYVRFGDEENHFTAALIGHMKRLAHGRNLPYHIGREQVEDSDDVFAGKADPNRSPRIDIAIRVNTLSLECYFTVECKRLRNGDMKLSKAYVEQGMLRFKSGRYAGTMSVAAMIGYVIRGDPQNLLAIINARIAEHEKFTAMDFLTQIAPIRTLSTIYESRHQREDTKVTIRLTHLLFDVSTRPPIIKPK